MKIGIVGWGLEAQSAYRFYGPGHEYLIANEAKQDDFPTPSDKIRLQYLDNEAPAGIGGQVQDLSYLKGVENCDKIVYQPTAYFNLKKVFGDDDGFWAKATTVYDIFFENCPTQKIIGITGTKGKGTTSTLIAKLLEAAGETAHLGGNIGTPILDILPGVKADDWVVWELANFQLKAASHSPHIAVCLMITPEHLDWHPNFEDYLGSKMNLFRHQAAGDTAIYFADNENSKKIAEASPGKKVPYFASPGARVRADGEIVIGADEQEIIKKTEVGLPGEHNLQNICAALTAVSEALGPDGAGSLRLKARGVLSSFTGLEHRLELVRELDGVQYYDDSFATTPDSVMVALQAVKRPIVLILGGHDKGLDYKDLVDEIADRGQVHHVVTIGEIGPKLAESLRQKQFTDITEDGASMSEIVIEARSWARPGDAVLLSTGTSSFGMFKDYKDRGDQFKKAVLELA